MRNFANKFLLLIIAFVVCWGQTGAVCVVAPLSLLAEDSVSTKTYYFDQYNQNTPTSQSLYQALGVSAYNDYLATVQAAQGLEEVVIAVVDSGLNPAHPVFANRILTEYGFNFSQGVSEDSEYIDDWNQDYNGHGTHVAGIIADMTLPNVKILPLKIFQGFENVTNGHAYENAIRYIYALKNGTMEYLLDEEGKLSYECNTQKKKLNIVAANLSLGTDGFRVNNKEDMASFNRLKYGYKENNKTYYGHQRLIDQLIKSDVMPIVAAGNYNTEYERRTQPCYYTVPGSCDGVLAVAAYENTGAKYERAKFSYWNNFVSISAPGENIWSACSQQIFDLFTNAEIGSNAGQFDVVQDNGEYKLYQNYKFNIPGENKLGKLSWIVRQDEYGNWCYRTNGTSMATPFVTACYAMLISDTSKTTAEDYGLPAWDDAEGATDEFFMNPAHKALLAAAATNGDQGTKGYDYHFGYGVLSLQSFATAEVSGLNVIKYEIKPADTAYLETGPSDTDWYEICVILFIGGILVWGFSYFKSYWDRRNIHDKEPE